MDITDASACVSFTTPSCQLSGRDADERENYRRLKTDKRRQCVISDAAIHSVLSGRVQNLNVSSDFHPYLIENSGSQGSLILRQKTSIMARNHFRGILNRITGLFVRPCLLENMGGQNIAYIMRSMGQQAFDRTPVSIWIVNTITLYCEPPCFVKRRLVISCIFTRQLYSFHEQRAWIFCFAEKDSPMPADVVLEVLIKIKQIGQNQPKWL